MPRATAGDVVVVAFPGAQGVKRRPAVVVSSDAYHQNRPDVILGLITSQLPDRAGPTDHILSEWQAAGLNKPSAFRAYLMTLPRGAISSPIGRLSAVDASGVRDCVSRALAT